MTTKAPQLEAGWSWSVPDTSPPTRTPPVEQLLAAGNVRRRRPRPLAPRCADARRRPTPSPRSTAQAPAALVFRRAQGGTQLVELYVCGEADPGPLDHAARALTAPAAGILLAYDAL